MFRDTELYKHAERELNMLLEDEKERNKERSIEDLEEEVKRYNGKTAQEFLNDSVLDIISTVDPKIHSRRSILYVLDLAYRLVQLENILPLTLDDSEFIDVLEQDGDILYQNKRNINVFKTKEKGVYHLHGKEALDLATGNYGINAEDCPCSSENKDQLSIFDYDGEGNLKESL